MSSAGLGGTGVSPVACLDTGKMPVPPHAQNPSARLYSGEARQPPSLGTASCGAAGCEGDEIK
jgi:hypothetical protein